MRHVLLALTAASVCAAPLAAQTVFTGQTLSPGGSVSGAALTARNNFLGSLAASTATNNFESFSDGDGAPLSLNFGFAGTASLQGSGEIEDASNSGRFATSGTNFWEQIVGPGNAFSVNFSQQVAGFGFYGTDIGDFSGRLTLDFFSGASAVTSFLVQDGDLSGNYRSEIDGNLLFWGVLYGSNTFDRIDFRLEGDTDQFGFDDMTVSDATEVMINVPEPGAVALLLTGLAGLVTTARRRRA